VVFSGEICRPPPLRRDADAFVATIFSFVFLIVKDLPSLLKKDMHCNTPTDKRPFSWWGGGLALLTRLTDIPCQLPLTPPLYQPPA
jgi:hypothetical protein